MSSPASRQRLPAWVLRVDPVAWFPVVAFTILAVLCVLSGNIWLALGALLVAASIVFLEAVVVGSDWINARVARRSGAQVQPHRVVTPVTPAAHQAGPLPSPRPAHQLQPDNQPHGSVPRGQARV